MKFTELLGILFLFYFITFIYFGVVGALRPNAGHGLLILEVI